MTCEELHAESPKGYIEFFNWCDEMNKTHKQIQCPVCGLYEVWIKRRK
jgi:hypothetical protein